MATNIITAKTDVPTREIAIKKLMEACDKDTKLRADLLRNPKEIATKYNVTLEPEEEKQLKRVGELTRVIEEFTHSRVFNPDWIRYPADVWWKQTLYDHIVEPQSLFNPLFHLKPFPFYPAPEDFLRRGLERQLGGFRR